MKRPWALIVVALLCVLLPLRGVLAHGMMAHDSMPPAAQASVAPQGNAPPCHTAAMDDMASMHDMADASGTASHDDATPHGRADKDCAAKCCLCSATCTAAALPALDRVTPHLPARFTFALLPAPRFHSAPLALPVEPPIARA
ncbi:MAG: hypothetical protein KGJ44_03100 [Betaproteobacteria bacterium]|nr:hypothetical protein [Betaproteobacteria bacterium]MDE2047372.1 hypothetical protein [Betaproteobacteria bacterium]